MHPDECCKKDGRHIKYLDDTKPNHRIYGDCDPGLWDALRALVDDGKRCVHCVEHSDILPPSTVFYSSPNFYPPHINREARKQARACWTAGAMAKTEGAAIVYLDPDTGLAPDSKKYLQKGPKYAYSEDLQAYWSRKQSIVLYQHLGMGSPAEEFIQDRAHDIKEALEVLEIFALGFRGRVFFVIPQAEHEEQLQARIGRFLKSPWGQNGNFELVDVPNV